MYQYASTGLGEPPETQPGNLAVPQCAAIPAKYQQSAIRRVTAARVTCPAPANAGQILRSVVARAVEMLDNTIGELVRAREAARRGGTPEGAARLSLGWRPTPEPPDRGGPGAGRTRRLDHLDRSHFHALAPLDLGDAHGLTLGEGADARTVPGPSDERTGLAPRPRPR